MVLGIHGSFHHTMVSETYANTMVVSRMLVWVHLQNLPLHLWDQPNLLGINNTISWYIKIDTQRLEERISTLAGICVEVYLSKGFSTTFNWSKKSGAGHRYLIMKIQHLDVESTEKQDTNKICALKPKKHWKKEENRETNQRMAIFTTKLWWGGGS